MIDIKEEHIGHYFKNIEDNTFVLIYLLSSDVRFPAVFASRDGKKVITTSLSGNISIYPRDCRDIVEYLGPKLEVSLRESTMKGLRSKL